MLYEYGDYFMCIEICKYIYNAQRANINETDESINVIYYTIVFPLCICSTQYLIAALNLLYNLTCAPHASYIILTFCAYDASSVNYIIYSIN